jgi:hypothetical protein
MTFRASRRRTQAGEIQPIGVVAIVLVIGLAAIVLWPVLTIFDLPFNQVQVSIQPAATIRGANVHVTGTTNLPDGAVVVCYLATEDGQVGNQQQATVAGGGFAADLPLAAATSGTLEADCRFGTAWAVQPKNVVDLVGSNGERMAGPQVFREGLTTPKELFASVALGSIGGPAAPGASPSAS